MILAHTHEKKIPGELVAISIIQSGFQNLPELSADHIAGLWSFSPFTVNFYGLVTKKKIRDSTPKKKP